MTNANFKLCDFDLQGKTHPDRPRELFDTVRLFEMTSFYRATSSCMSETDRQKCLDVLNGRLTSAYVEVGNQLFYLNNLTA